MSVQSRFRFFVLWQSLVVDSYRSFFTHLLNKSGCSITLAAPHAFRELGGQLVICAPFLPPFTPRADKPGQSHILKCFSPHVQIAYFAGLRKTIRMFRQPAPGKPIFLCIAEPYSVTALLAWLIFRTTSGPKVWFITYSAQNIYKKLNPVLSLIQNFLFRRSDTILVCGHEQEAVLKKHGYAGPVIYFPLWYDQKRFQPMPRLQADKILGDLAQFDETSVRFGYCGAMTEEKGVHDLLRFFKSGAVPETARLFCVGSGPLAKDAAAGEKVVQYLGRLATDQVSAFMNAIDVLIVPSRTTAHWKEQFGRVIVEAMACGTIVIGSDSGEIPFVINDPGRIFKEGDQSDLERVIRTWTAIVSSPRMKTEQQYSIQRSKLFTDDACATRFLDAISGLLD